MQARSMRHAPGKLSLLRRKLGESLRGSSVRKYEATLYFRTRFTRSPDFAVEIAVWLRHTACHKFLGPTLAGRASHHLTKTFPSVDVEHRYSPAKQTNQEDFDVVCAN